MSAEPESKITFGMILKYGLLVWACLLLIKWVFLSWWGLGNFTVVVYYLLIILVSRKLCRKIGVINILEAGFIGIMWAIIILLLDSLLAKKFIDAQVFATGGYWFSYLAMFLAVFFLHNKRHIHIRKEQAHHH